MKKIIPFLLLAFVGLLYSCYKETVVPVMVKFTTAFKDGDESVPVYIAIENLTEGADTYQWTFEGGTPATSNKREPGAILYTEPGTYTITLTASNVDGEKETYSYELVIKDAIDVRFTTAIIDSDYPPVAVRLTNQTEGQNFTYQWRFEGGSPATFDGQHPPDVVFADPGNHLVELTVSNGFESRTKTDTITVRANLMADFTWETAFEDYDYQAPVKLYINNTTQNAISYQWSCAGATPSASTEQHPELNFAQPGTYTIQLVASNGKTTQTVQKQVTIHPNTGIYILENVMLGVNYAHNTNNVGAFYSTRLRRSFTASEVTQANAADIDIAFQGQDHLFAFNKFVSPDAISQYGFASIPGAMQTLFINSQEICNCGLNFTAAQFDAMTTDAPLQGLTIPNSTVGQQQFDNSQVPRIVLFKTQDGRKGAIKVKQFVATSIAQSYILCDIKVQK